MSFSGQSNPPWQRNLNNTGNQLPSLFGANQAMNMQNATIFGPQSMGMPGQNGLFNQNQMPPQMSYSQTRGLNPVAFGATGGPPPLMGSSTNPQGSIGSQQEKSFMGFVTKIQNDYGFIDNDIFFPLKVCKTNLKIGDRVLVDANLQPGGNFDWVAWRVKMIPESNTSPVPPPPPNISGHISKSSAVPPTGDYPWRRTTPDRHDRIRRDSRERDRERDRDRDRDRHRERDRERERERDREREREREDEALRKKRREDREKSREKERREVDKSRERSRERSPKRVPSKRKRGILPPYMVDIPKVNLIMEKADCFDLTKRYRNLYIPSDFFFSNIKWPNSFPPNKPFSIQRPCLFHILNREVKYSNTVEDNEPKDLDYKFSAKVMLMSCPPMAEFYNKCFYQDVKEDRECMHPSRLIKFLIGTRGKTETMAIGGPWSRSLDGENPESDPIVLIRTAIRNCKELTGIDLSGCTQWYRFVELYYHRGESVHKGQTIPARVETVVIFLPDVNSCMPTPSEWKISQLHYQSKLDQILSKSDTNSNDNTIGDGNNIEGQDSSTIIDGDNNGDDTGAGGNITKPTKDIIEKQDTNTMDSSSGDKDEETQKGTHFSKLDPKTMKIQALREELEARNIESKGLKPQLIARLTKVLRLEKANEENKKTGDEEEIEDSIEIQVEHEMEIDIEKDNFHDNITAEDTLDSKKIESEDESVKEPPPPGEIDLTDMVVLDEYDANKYHNKKVQRIKEIENDRLTRRYSLPESPHIIVTPSKTAKGGSFTCRVVSLSVLLDYRPADNKERSFEVSVFAELFNEMLMRDCGFEIYKELTKVIQRNLIIEKEKELEKEKDKDKEKEKENKDKEKKKEKAKEKKSEKDKEEKDEDTNKNKAATDSTVTEKENVCTEKQKVSETSVTDSKKEREKKGERHSKNHSRERESSKSRERKASRDRSREREKRKRLHSESEDEEKRKIKTYIANKPLLFSFIYFDTTNCGFIYEKDLEDLLNVIGLSLSRNQIKSFLGKANKRNPLHYRKLTDKPKEDDKVKEIPLTEVKHITEQGEDEVLDEVVPGNLHVFPIFADSQQNSSKTQNDGSKNNSEIIIHNGAILDVGKLLEQQKRGDKAREEVEEELLDLKTKYNEIMSSNTKAQLKIKNLQSEIKNLTRKIKEAEDCLFSYTRKHNEYHSVLQNVYEEVAPIFRRERERERDRDKKVEDRERKDQDNTSNDKNCNNRTEIIDEVKEEIKTEIKNEDNSSELDVKEDKMTE